MRANFTGHNSCDYGNVPEMLRGLSPSEPVYCIYPEVYRQAAREFLHGFPGRVLYAVKANDDARIIALLYEAGIRHFDCASIPEIATVRDICPDAICYFMTPVRLRGAARTARYEFGVRHFTVDDLSGLEGLSKDIDLEGTVVFVRMAVGHPAALQNFSAKFGARPGEIPGLLKAVRDTGAEPALSFNVGSSVISPDAYAHALGVAKEVLSALSFRLRLVDIGGGFPRSYPGFQVPPLSAFFQVCADFGASLSLAEGAELLAEPGRALAAPGFSAVVEVLLRKDRRVYLNDGMYGIFWELRFKAHDRYPVRAFRDGRELRGETVSCRLYGPTCDGSDVLPGGVAVPADLKPGDYLEFGGIGAYSLAGRTRFNGHYSENIVTITDSGAAPPA